MTPAPKLVLCVVDAMAPAMLERAVAEGEAPVMAELMARGLYVRNCVAAFPSVTPVCAASIITGVGQERHRIPAMNWYHREERRYIEYGSSFRSAQRFGITRQLTDTVYNMNRAHLAAEELTLFESLDDAGERTAGTTYLMYRGRFRHEPQRDSTLTRIASTLMRHPVMGPRELFYADIFASRRTGCRSNLGMPGVRDRHSGCVGAYLVEHELFDFMLLSLPDNDWHSHKLGPDAQVQSLAAADLQLARVMEAGGGVDAFLEDHAVVVMADHSQALVSHTVALQDELADFDVLPPGGSRRGDPRIALCPSQRAAMVYLLAEDESPTRRAALKSEVLRRTLQIDGVDLVMWLDHDSTHARLGAQAVIARPSLGELRFSPEGDMRDMRGQSWTVEGELAVLGVKVQDGRLHSPDYPDGLSRVWSALTCPTSGEILLSAASGYEFLDWGRQAHVGGGSHGSLHAEDSLGALIVCGVDIDSRTIPEQWAIRDVAPLVLRHFGLSRASS